MNMFTNHANPIMPSGVAVCTCQYVWLSVSMVKSRVGRFKSGWF